MKIPNYTPNITKIAAKRLYNVTDTIFVKSLMKDEYSVTEILAKLTRQNPERLNTVFGEKNLAELETNWADLKLIEKQKASLPKYDPQRITRPIGQTLLGLFKYHKLVDENGNFTKLPAKWIRYKGNVETPLFDSADKILIYGNNRSKYEKLMDSILMPTKKSLVVSSESILIKNVENDGLHLCAKNINISGKINNLDEITGSNVIANSEELKFKKATIFSQFKAKGKDSFSGSVEVTNGNINIEGYKTVNANVNASSRVNIKGADSTEISGHSGMITTIDSKTLNANMTSDYGFIAKKGSGEFTGKVTADNGRIHIGGYSTVDANLDAAYNVSISGADITTIAGHSGLKTEIDSKNIQSNAFKAECGFTAENGNGRFSGSVEANSGDIDIDGYKTVNAKLEADDRVSIAGADTTIVTGHSGLTTVIDSKSLQSDGFKADCGFTAKNGSEQFNGFIESRNGFIKLGGYKTVDASVNAASNIYVTGADSTTIVGHSGENTTIDSKNLKTNFIADKSFTAENGIGRFFGSVESKDGDIGLYGYKMVNADLNASDRIRIAGADKTIITGHSGLGTRIDSKNLYADAFKADTGFSATKGSGLFSGEVESIDGGIYIFGYNKVELKANTPFQLRIKAANATVSGSAHAVDFSGVDNLDLSKGFTVKLPLPNTDLTKVEPKQKP